METLATPQRPNTVLFKVMYGALFTIMLPAALVSWAHATRNVVHLPAIHSTLWGVITAGAGMVITASGMLSLWTRGGGLPMNAFPPPRYVQSGLYRLVPHPIYGGFVIICAGVSIASGSASGLWLVTPFAALASAALVVGYELPDLKQRFGSRLFSPWLVADDSAPPLILERFCVYLVVLLPWLVVFEAISRLGSSLDSVTTYMPFEMRLPIIESMEIPYASTYLVVLLAPLLATTRSALRRFTTCGLVAMGFVFPLYLLLPCIVPPRPFNPATLVGNILSWERTPYSGSAAFPSFHVVWALIAAYALGGGKRWKVFAWFGWAALVAISCVATGMHSIADTLAGVIAFLIVLSARGIWMALLYAAERIANSWKEWRLGPVRIINHGAYAAAGTLVGMLMIDTLLGPGRQAITLGVFVCATVGAALWAQLVEGSPSLLRPLGFYGAVIGAIIGATAAILMGLNIWIALAAICVAAPWIQSIGRLRCLVQGCCHGRAAETVPGIRYTHPRSRVCRLSTLGGIPVHATPVYSIVWNGFIAAVLLRLLHLHSPSTLICGIYLMLTGVGRFVEEAYRGEPQTLIVRGLRLYQWLAIAMLIAGAVVTTLDTAPVLQEHMPRISSLAIATGCGLVAWFVTGVDFPESSRRFARLT